MAVDQKDKYRDMVIRGKYQRLYSYLSSLQVSEWRTSFNEVEAVIGFELPPSARLHRPWWGNQRGGNGHSHALAWSVAGWETAEVDMDAETLLFRRTHAKPIPRLPLDAAWPDIHWRMLNGEFKSAADMARAAGIPLRRAKSVGLIVNVQ